MQTLSARRFVVFLIAASGVFTALLIAPFLGLFAVAAVFAVSLFPLQEKLSAKLGDRRTLAASIISIGFVILVLAPVVAVSVSLLTDLVEIATEISQRIRAGGVGALIDVAPEGSRAMLRGWLARLQVNPSTLQESIGSYSAAAIRMATAFLGGVGTALLQATLMVVALTVFLIEGKRILTWVRGTVPLEMKHSNEILEELRKASHSVVVSNIGTALIQSVVALIGFLIAGATHLLVATFVTFVLAFIPAIGAGGSVFVVAALVYLGGGTWQGIFLALWGFIAVGLVDNLAKPLLMKRGIEMHGALAFFSILAGIAAFGPIGIITGPMIVTLGVCVVRIYKRDFPPMSS
jgi:predicted PurR-regulated permease PerM